MKKSKRRGPLLAILVAAVVVLIIGLTAAGVFAMSRAGGSVANVLSRFVPVPLAPEQELMVRDFLTELPGLQPDLPATIYDRGLLVSSVDPEGAAAQGGVRRGTIILAIDGQEVDSFEALQSVLAEKGPGASIVMRVINSPEPEEIQVTLAEDAPFLGIRLAADAQFDRFMGRLPGQGLPEEFERIVPPGALPGDGFEFRETVPTEVVVAAVIDGSAASTAGLLAGDKLLALDGTSIDDVEKAVALIAEKDPGDSLTLQILRDGEEQSLTAQLGEHPDTAGQAFLGVRLTMANSDFDFERDFPFAPGQFDFESQDLDVGAVVVEVTEGSPADEAGIVSGDVILAVDGQEVHSVDELVALFADYEPGTTIELTLLRDGETRIVDAHLGFNPEESGRAFLGVRLGSFYSMRVRPFEDGETGQRGDPGGFYFQLDPETDLGSFFGHGNDLGQFFPDLFNGQEATSEGRKLDA